MDEDRSPPARNDHRGLDADPGAEASSPWSLLDRDLRMVAWSEHVDVELSGHLILKSAPVPTLMPRVNKRSTYEDTSWHLEPDRQSLVLTSEAGRKTA